MFFLLATSSKRVQRAHTSYCCFKWVKVLYLTVFTLVNSLLTCAKRAPRSIRLCSSKKTPMLKKDLGFCQAETLITYCIPC